MSTASLQNFGEHGRELISSEIALRLLRLLCDEAQRAPLLQAYGLSPAHVNQLLQRAVFKVSASAGWVGELPGWLAGLVGWLGGPTGVGWLAGLAGLAG